MKLLVTGAAGFIGSNFVRRALNGDYPGLSIDRLVILDALTYAGNEANLAPVAADDRYRFVAGDITDADTVRSLMADVDTVVHFAAESHVDRSIEGAAPFVMTNVLGTQTLLEAARNAGVATFVHVSTDEVYGSIEVGSWTEGQCLAPNSPYSASKAGSDLLALAYHQTYGMDVRITRCSNNYGPYQFPEKVIPLFITNLMDGLKVPLYGDGGNVRDWLHVDDHCRGIALVTERGHPGQVYHVGGGREMTNRELTGVLLKAMGVGWERVQPVADRPGHDRRYALSTARAQSDLGYRPLVAFEDGIAETIDWYRRNESWWRPLKGAP